MQTYTVLNIFRTNEQTPSFVIAVFDTTKEYYRIDKSLTDRVSKGMVFIGDRIQLKETTIDGVIFDVFPEETKSIIEDIESEIDFFYLESKRMIKPHNSQKIHYLPYLCDILPYSNLAVNEVNATPIYKDGIFAGKYQIDHLEVSNIKLPLPSMFIAKIVQKTRINTYPTSFNPFFFVIVSSNNILLKIVFWSESLREYSSLKVGDIILVKDYKMKKKWTMVDKIDPNTFTESAYFDVEEITAKELAKIKFDKKAAQKHVFDCVEGKITYLSVLLRHNCNGTLLEYVLVKVGDKSVVLYYNSDSEFYKIQTGSYIKITELRKIQRAGFDLFISTIYTQFELSLSANDTPDLDSVSKKIKIGEEQPEIFGAIGFIPDNFRSLSEILDYDKKEKVMERELSISLFMKPTNIALSDLTKQPLLLNESKKFIVNCKITKIIDIECIIDYLENGESKKQGSFAIVLDDLVEVFVYENFFNSTESDYPSLSFKNNDLKLLSVQKNLVIEAFRADETSVLYYLTGIINDS